jgi:hypothetical protein
MSFSRLISFGKTSFVIFPFVSQKNEHISSIGIFDSYVILKFISALLNINVLIFLNVEDMMKLFNMPNKYKRELGYQNNDYKKSKV